MTEPLSLAAELAITATNAEVWVAIAQALLLLGVCLVFGIWAARAVGLLGTDAPAGEAVAVGLASGLVVLTAWWAALASGGRSSFTPVAVGFALAIALALVRRGRRRGGRRPAATVGSPAAAAAEAAEAAEESTGALGRSSRHGPLFLSALAGAAFVVAVALLYGATLAPSPRDGVQPVEKMDTAFYAVLSADLAATGTESNVAPSGFDSLPGVPAQTWYHWGELWLASAAITIFGAAPLPARYLVVLPVLLLAAAALTGTLVRRMTGTASRGAFAFGFLACLFLSPIPVVYGPFFSAWAAGMLFGIIVFGMAAVAVLLVLYGLTALDGRRATWALAGFVGSAAAFVVPAHIVVAVLGLVGVASVCTIRILRSGVRTRRLPAVPPIWRRTFIATAIALVATVAWGVLTGHGPGGGGSPSSVAPFNATWRETMAMLALGAGALLAIPVAWLLDRRHAPARADLYLGTMVIVLAGAIAWGARLGDFNMFYFFFGGILVFAVPVTAVAVWALWQHLRRTRHPRLAAGVIIVCAVQLELGVVLGLGRLGSLGAYEYAPISVELLGAIRRLPPDARLAYACGPFEEISFVNSRLISIDAHTGRRVVPMCFEGDVNSIYVGAPASVQVAGSGFALAPQSALYPDAAARPSSAAVAAFLKDHGIDYIYADARHPNSLVADAVPIASSGGGQILRVP